MTELKPGMRVKVKGDPIGYTLTTPWGTIEGPDDDWEGYWLVKLDHPAFPRVPGGVVLREIEMHQDNLEWWGQTPLPLDNTVKINPKWAWEG